MNFLSIQYAVLLLSTVVLYYVLPQRGRMTLLLVASYIFYGFWNITYCALIAGSTLLHYASALAIEESTSPRRRRVILAVAVTTSLAILAYFKYTNFAIETLRMLFGLEGNFSTHALSVILPAGISFYTFRDISYTVDVYRRDLRAERDLLVMSLFVSFFPQLVAGPIERAKDMIPQLARRLPFERRWLEDGGRLLAWGFLKKIIGDRVTVVALPAFMHPNTHSSAELFLSAHLMMLVIYLDFSGYSDIATGSARLFGIRLTRNFNYPIASANIAEFWRRWHITMSTWVRDYLFMPLGGYHPRNAAQHIRITLITMGLVGLWHGARWTFVLWGLYHGVRLAAYQLLHLRVFRRFRSAAWIKSLPWSFCGWVATRMVISMSIVLFFSPTLRQALHFYDRMFIHWTKEGFNAGTFGVGCALLVAFWIFHYWQSLADRAAAWNRLHPAVRGAGYAVLLLVLLATFAGRAQNFIYFQF